MKMTPQERINAQQAKKLEGLIASAEKELEAMDKKDKAGIKFITDRVSALNSQLSRLGALQGAIETNTAPQSGKAGGKKKKE